MAGKLVLGFGLGWVRLSWLGMAVFEPGLGSAGFGGQLGVTGFRDAFCRAAFRGKDEDSLSRSAFRSRLGRDSYYDEIKTQLDISKGRCGHFVKLCLLHLKTML